METDAEANKGKTLKRGTNDSVEKATYLWFIQERARGTPISGPVLTQKALQFYGQLNDDAPPDEFKASSGWLDRFKRRHEIRQHEIRQIDSIQPFIIKLFDLIQQNDTLQPDQLYNADETGLFWRLLPDNTLVSAHEMAAPGIKSARERITQLCCTNAIGNHKLKPMVIGKYQRPRCFKNVNMDALTVHYCAQKNAWMNTFIFERWFHHQFVITVKQYLKGQGLQCKAILFLDNCAAHPDQDVLRSRDGLIQCVFLPPNTTSMIQQLDGGTLETTKRNYRKLLLERVVATNTEEKSHTLLEAIKNINIKDVTYMVGEAWDQVKPNAIAKVWLKTLLNRVDTLRHNLKPNCSSITSTDSEGDFTTESKGLNNESEGDAVIISE